MTARLVMCLALLSVPRVSAAQFLPPGVQGLTAQFSSTCVATTCATWAMGTAPVVTITVTGTFSGTITWEGSSDGGQTYTVLNLVNLADGTSASTTTAAGKFSIANSGLTHVQARMTSYASGGANVLAIRGFVSAKLIPFSSANPVSPANGGTGISSYAIGDLIYASAATTLSKLPDVATGAVLVSGGVTTAPAYSTTPTVTSVTLGTGGVLSSGGAAGKIQITGTTPMLQLGGTTSASPALKQNSAAIDVKLADDSAFANINAATFSGNLNYASSVLRGAGQSLLASSTAPSALSACGAGTAPTFVWSNGTATFEILTGSSTPVSTCTWTMPAASNRWVCDAVDITTQSTSVFYMKQTASSTTSVTVTNYNTAGAATAVVASDHLLVKCLGG